MKYFKHSLVALTVLLTTSAYAIEDKSAVEQLEEFNYQFPELSESDHFTKMVFHDKSTGVKIFFSKNMPQLQTTKSFSNGILSTAFAVSCTETEDEICSTKTKNGRIIEQSCKCTTKAGGPSTGT